MKKYEKEIDKFTRKLESMRKNPLGRALKYDNNFNNKFYLAHYVKILSSAHVICDKINHMLDYNQVTSLTWLESFRVYSQTTMELGQKLIIKEI